MSPNTFRLLGFILLFAAVVFSVLNLHRVADLRMPWLAPLFVVLGAVFMLFARRRAR